MSNDTAKNRLKIPQMIGFGSLGLIPIAVWMVLQDPDMAGPGFMIGLLQLGMSWFAAAWMFWIAWRSEGRPRKRSLLMGLLLGFFGLAGMSATLFGVTMTALGAAWGRPLRVKGRQLFPELREGADWTQGDRPDASGLDAATRRALEALWLHDAQKEHASVPAFSRISWMLAAVGAPAELMVGAHQAAMEEIDHARRCFALAAGYGDGRTHTVEPMPDLLLGGMDLKGDPMVLLAVESLKDGCLLEDFNADVAAKCVSVCEEPATRGVLERIALEERSHAEFSWDVLAFTLERGGERVRKAVERALDELDAIQRPTAASTEKAALVAAADPRALRAHGRLTDDAWADCWSHRVTQTRLRTRELLDAPVAQAAK